MIESLVRHTIDEAVTGAPGRLRRTTAHTARRTRRPAVPIERLEARQLLSDWTSTAMFATPNPMYVVHHDTGTPATTTSGVIFAGNDGTNGGIFYKQSDSSTTNPAYIGGGVILGAVKGVDPDDDGHNDDVTIILNGGQLYWAYDGTMTSFAGWSNLEISNFCAVDGKGFYFSTWHPTDGARLWFTDLANGAATPTSDGIAGWQLDTHISWITAVPGNATYDVMFSGDRCYRIAPPYPATRYHDGRELWGMVSSAASPTRIHDNIGDEINHPCPWYGNEIPPEPPLYNKCPEQMVISNNTVAVGGVLYFTTQSNMFSQLWKSDGTAAGTVPIYNAAELPWYTWYSDHYESYDYVHHYGETVGFTQVAGIDGYLTPGDDGELGTADDKPQVFFWLSYSQPSAMWVTDGTPYDAFTKTGTEPQYIDGFYLHYCTAPQIPGQHEGGNPLVIVKDPTDPDYGTVYFTAGVNNYDAETIYSLYKIDPGDSAVSGDVTWDGDDINAVWDSGGGVWGALSACKWLTPIDGKLYFRGDDPSNSNNMRGRELYVYDSSVTLAGLSDTSNMDVSQLTWDPYADGGAGRLYFFSLFGTQAMDTRVKLWWWDLND